MIRSHLIASHLKWLLSIGLGKEGGWKKWMRYRTVSVCWFSAVVLQNVFDRFWVRLGVNIHIDQTKISCGVCFWIWLSPEADLSGFSLACVTGNQNLFSSHFCGQLLPPLRLCSLSPLVLWHECDEVPILFTPKRLRSDKSKRTHHIIREERRWWVSVPARDRMEVHWSKM